MAKFTGLGTEDKRKVAVVAGLGVVVLALAAHTIFGGPDVTSATPAIATRPAAVAGEPGVSSRSEPATRGSSAALGGAAGVIDPALHPELMAENENYLYTGSGRNIFSQTSGAPPSAEVKIENVKAPARPSHPIAVNTGPPPPPSIDLKFFGYAARKNGSRRAFLTHGEDVFVASEGDVVSHRYRVVRIAPFSVEIEDLPYHNTQTLPLVQN